MIQGENQNV